jgi:hypothetical protein
LTSLSIPRTKIVSCAVSLTSVLSSIAKENHWKLAAFSFNFSSMLFERSSIFVPIASRDRLISEIIYFYQEMQHLQLRFIFFYLLFPRHWRV